MSFELNDEQKMMIDTVCRFIKCEVKPLLDEVEQYGLLSGENALCTDFAEP